MKIFILAALLQAAAFSGTTAYPITGSGVHCRNGPGTSYAIKTSFAKGTDVKISCQTEGESIFGNSIWDKVGEGCYVSDYYVNTGKNGYVTSKCASSGGGSSGGSGSSKIPGPVGDDYPYKSSCGGVDPWEYYKCQCTSFVAWRINSRLGLKFTNEYKGVNWGNADTWDSAARATGVTVNDTPVPGCVAQTDAGSKGHVAWVAAVNGEDTVEIEEYNAAVALGYDRRTVKRGEFRYIHVKV